jgi:hypothetical protein
VSFRVMSGGVEERAQSGKLVVSGYHPVTRSFVAALFPHFWYLYRTDARHRSGARL